LILLLASPPHGSAPGFWCAAATPQCRTKSCPLQYPIAYHSYDERPRGPGSPSACAPLAAATRRPRWAADDSDFEAALAACAPNRSDVHRAPGNAGSRYTGAFGIELYFCFPLSSTNPRAISECRRDPDFRFCVLGEPEPLPD